MKKNTSYTPEALLKHIEQTPHPMRLDEILQRTNISRRLKKEVQATLYQLAEEGHLVRLKGGAWAAAAMLKTVSGIVAVQRSGAGFVTLKDNKGKGRDIYIAPQFMGGAWNGDEVEITILPSQTGRAPEGVINNVVHRAHEELTVRVVEQNPPSGQAKAAQREGTAMLTRPVDSRINADILVRTEQLPRPVQGGDLLLVKLEEEVASPTGVQLWLARGLEILGREDDVRAQELITKLNYEIPTAFPDDALAEAETVAHHVPAPDEKTRDMRSLPLVTIDGADAKDFDDAIYVEPTEKGWRLIVAIADVSLFVRPMGKLDREARDRGNSYYFPASVEPMLPEALSNGVCSLRPREDRRVMVADMELSREGKPQHSTFYAGIMYSRARLTYEEVQTYLDAADASTSMEPEVGQMLTHAAQLAQTLIQRRAKDGGLDFDLPEAQFVVESGQVVDVRNRERLFSHRLIEAFMVEANEAVAVFLGGKRQPLLYRIHPAPSAEKLSDLANSLRELDLPQVRLPKKTQDPVWLAPLLRKVAGSPQAWLVDTLALRSMMQARYDPDQDIHFGLASTAYCHFTSPIRRYADLVNHRALRHALGLETFGSLPSGEKLLQVAEICNIRERRAQEAEREITRRLGTLLLRDRIGAEYTGLISGVINFGLFVQLEGLPLEGMIRVETLGNEYFEYDQNRHELRGQHTGVKYRLGDKVQVKLVNVSVERLEIDLVLTGEFAPATSRSQSKGRARRVAPRSQETKKRPASRKARAKDRRQKGRQLRSSH